jgi:hypothetical protein
MISSVLKDLCWKTQSDFQIVLKFGNVTDIYRWRELGTKVRKTIANTSKKQHWTIHVNPQMDPKYPQITRFPGPLKLEPQVHVAGTTTGSMLLECSWTAECQGIDIPCCFLMSKMFCAIFDQIYWCQSCGVFNCCNLFWNMERLSPLISFGDVHPSLQCWDPARLMWTARCHQHATVGIGCTLW